MNQHGFVTLEIICVIMIISILTAIAVPQMTRWLDKARLDYEMKTFLNNLELARSLNRSTNYKPVIFKNNPKLENGDKVIVDIKNNAYDLRTGDNIKKIKLHDGFSIDGRMFDNHINVDEDKTGHVIITSRYGDKRYIYRDPVGRWSVDYKDRYQ